MSLDLQLVVKQLSDDLAKVTAERDALAAAVLEEQRLCALKCKSLASLVAEMRDACSEPIGDDPRMHYVEVQIDRGDWDGLFRDRKGVAANV